MYGGWCRASASRFPATRGHADYDGVAELWFDDEATLLAARKSAEWKASSEDEVNFIDHSRVAYFVSREHVIVGEGGAGDSK